MGNFKILITKNPSVVATRYSEYLLAIYRQSLATLLEYFDITACNTTRLTVCNVGGYVT